MAGIRSKVAGEAFERMLNASCKYYQDEGVAVIEKTPEPMRIIKAYDRHRGQYIAIFEKQAQADYKGVLCDGKAILFEAKHTDQDRISRNVITETQENILDDFAAMGAQCFVFVSFGFKNYYRVPWNVFRDMKKIFGRKYIKESEMMQYRITVKNCLLLILDGIEINE